MKTEPKGSPFGHAMLITGSEELLIERAARSAVARARDADREAELIELQASTADASRLAEIAGASLFAARRVIVIRGLADLPTELGAQLIELVDSGDEDVALVMVHGGGNKGRALIDKLKKSGVIVNDCPAVRSWEMAQFVVAEFRRLEIGVSKDLAQFLVDAIGPDLRALSAAANQLAADAAGEPITIELARRYFAGRGEVSGFAVADAVLSGQMSVALEQLRWAVSTGVAPVLLSSALASGLRGLGRFISASGSARDADVATETGVPVWKLKSLRAQARGWDQASVAAAIAVVARVDAEVKGLADDPAHALERAVLDIERARSQAMRAR